MADNQETVRDLIDDGGNLIEHLTYDSFGKLVNTPTTDFRYGYTGREWDNETGLDYYRARYYDASNGRFISEDPLSFGGGDTNIYRYVGNSPINWTDPRGLGVVTAEDKPITRLERMGGGGSGGLPSGGNFGGSNLGGGNFSVSPYTGTNINVGNYGNTRGLLQNSPSGLPASLDSGNFNYSPYQVNGTVGGNVNSVIENNLRNLVNGQNNATPVPGNNPNVPDPNKCIKFTQRDSEMVIPFWNDVKTKGDRTHNKKCRYAYIIPDEPNSRANIYARFVSNSPYEFALINVNTGENQLYDGSTPGTNRLWGTKSTLDTEVDRLRDIYNRGKADIRSLTTRSELRSYNKLTQGNPDREHPSCATSTGVR